MPAASILTARVSVSSAELKAIGTPYYPVLIPSSGNTSFISVLDIKGIFQSAVNPYGPGSVLDVGYASGPSITASIPANTLGNAIFAMPATASGYFPTPDIRGRAVVLRGAMFGNGGGSFVFDIAYRIITL